MTKMNVTRHALIPAIMCPMCILFSFGFSIGSINVAYPSLAIFYNESHLIRYGTAMDIQTLDLLLTITASLYPVGGIFGVMFVPSLVQQFGRRNLLIYSQSICVIGTLLQCIAPATNSYEVIIVGRVINGFYAAIGTGIGPIYVNDISATHIRGLIGSLFSVSIAVGVWAANVLGLEQVLGTTTGWPYLFALNAIPSIVLVLFSSWFPESPRYLYLNKGDEEGALKVLQYLRGVSDISNEIRSLKEEAEMNEGIEILGLFEILKSRESRWQLISTAIILVACQLNGINGIQFYLNEVFINAGLSEDIIPYIGIGVLSAQICVTLTGGILCEKFGRKSLLLVGNSAICVSIAVYTLATAFQQQQSWLSFISIVAALGFIFGFNIGPGPVAFGITPELNNHSTRPSAMTWGVLLFWTSFSAVGFATPYMFEYLTFAVFLPYLGITLLSMIFIYIVVPETKGKSILAIQTHFDKWNRGSAASSTYKSSQYLNESYEQEFKFSSKL